MAQVATQYSALLPERVDVTHQELAFGRQAIPKLINEAIVGDLHLQQRAIVALDQFLRDAQFVAQSLDAGILPMLRGLITASAGDVTVRQKAIDCLYRLATHQIGRAAILQQGLLETVCTEALMCDTDPYVRLKVHSLIVYMTTIPRGARAFLALEKTAFFCERLFAERLLEVQKQMLATLYNLLRHGEAPTIPELPLKIGLVDSLVQLLAPTSITSIKEHALECLMILAFHAPVRQLLCAPERLAAVGRLLEDWKSSVRAAAAGAIMTIAIDCTAKQILVRDLYIPKLVALIQDDNALVQLNALKALTNCAEDYRGRFQLRTSLSTIETCLSSSDDNVCRAAADAIKVITWTP